MLRRKMSCSKYAFPEGRHREIEKHGYVELYDCLRCISVCVFEHLKKDNSTGSANRDGLEYMPDPDDKVPPESRATVEDYENCPSSGLSHGHLAACCNHVNDQRAMIATFYLSNIIPQDIDNNRKIWSQLEKKCIKTLGKYGYDLWILTGPLFVSQNDCIVYMLYGKVAVPTHMYKIIIAEKSKNEYLLGVYVVPNRNVPGSVLNYKKDLHFIETHSELKFLPLKGKTFGDLSQISFFYNSNHTTSSSDHNSFSDNSDNDYDIECTRTCGPIKVSVRNKIYYWNSEYLEGHLVEADQSKKGLKLEENYDRTFSQSGIWSDSKNYCNDIATKFDHVYVTSGPLFLPHSNNGKKYVNYKVKRIGNNEIPITTHMFRVIVAENKGEDETMLAVFVLDVSSDCLYDFDQKDPESALQFVEKHSGLTFSPLLKGKELQDLCKAVPPTGYLGYSNDDDVADMNSEHCKI